MAKIFLAIFLFAISFNSINAMIDYQFRNEVNVGKSPSKIFSFDDNGFFVVCLGEDANYDGKLNEGEELPSVWYVNYNKASNTYSSEKKFTFDDFTNYPYGTVRFGVDKEGRALYVPLRRGVISLSLEDFDIIDDAVSNISANGLEYIAGHLLISYNDENGNGKLTVVNLFNNQVLQTLNIGTNLQETIYFQSPKGISIAALSVGPYGESYSKVFYGAINHKFDFALSDSVLLGDTGNHLQYSNGKIYATVNMSHVVIEIDPIEHTTRTFHTGTAGYNGPRESVVHNGKLFVSTYAEDIRIFNLETGVLESIINSNNDLHLEGLSMLNEKTLAVSGILTNSYVASQTVEIYQKSESIEYPMTTYNVGTAPIWIENIDGVINIICAGNDKNSNGIFDEGEENASWWIIEKGVAEKKLDINLTINFFPTLDRINKLLFIPHRNVIRSYSYEDYNIADDAVANINAKSLEFAGGHLLIAKSNDDNPDSIFVLNLSNGMILQKLPAGNEIYGLKYYPDPKGIGLAFTAYYEQSEEYKLMYGPITHMVDFKLDNEVVLDGTPTQLIFKDDNLITISPETGTSFMVDVNTKDYSTYNFCSYDDYGPISILKESNYLISSTLNSDLRAMNIQSYELEEIVPLEGKGLFLNNIGKDELNIAVCSPYDKNMNISNKVFMMKKIPVSVEDKITYENVKIFPNPAQDYIRLDLRNINYQSINIKLIDNNGNLVKQFDNLSSNQIDIRNLNTGSYILNVKFDNNYFNLPLRIVR